MPEGPSIVILREEAAALVGQTVVAAAGNSRQVDPGRFVGRRLLEMKSWGKHFLMRFAGFTLRVHFMLYGRYTIGERKPQAPRLRLTFRRGEISFYACSVRLLEGDLDQLYDWSADIMASAWSPRAARRKLQAQPDLLACDAILDQGVFSGAGNIIKNEVLWRVRVHPQTRIGALPSRKLGALIRDVRVYSFLFYEWRKAHVLRQHWNVHARTTCPRCKVRLHYQAHLGRAQRRAFWCAQCQVRYR